MLSVFCGTGWNYNKISSGLPQYFCETGWGIPKNWCLNYCLRKGQIFGLYRSRNPKLPDLLHENQLWKCFSFQENDEPTGDGVDLYDDVLTSSSSIKQETNGKEKITTLSSHANSLLSSSSFIGAPLQLHGNSQTKRVQLYVGNLTWVRFIRFHL